MAKIGDGSLGAFLRGGLNELRNLVYADSNIAQKQVEYGMFGHPTPGEVAAGRNDNEQNLEQETAQPSILDRKLEQAMSRDDRSADRSMSADHSMAADHSMSFEVPEMG